MLALHRTLVVLGLCLGVLASKKDCGCTRTMKNRAHLHPSVYNLPELTTEQLYEIEALPKEFDWCDQGMCTPSWNQHIPQYCGSCFAHGALHSAQDRIKIQNSKKGFQIPDVMLGRQSFLNCAPGHGLSGGCDGGEPTDVYEFMRVYGLPDETCLPYNATDNSKYVNTNGTCPPEGYCMNCMYTKESPTVAQCYPVTKMVRYRAKEYGRVSGEHAIMKELLNGPVTCGIACSDGFTNDYVAGIYKDTTNFTDIDHDVEIVGWGEEDGVKFWHIRNSWGTYWGENGFFRIVRGKNNLAIEQDCHYVIPDASEEELVWSRKPAYGGSIYGIKPFSDLANEFPLNDTTGIYLDNTQLVSHEISNDNTDDSMKAAQQLNKVDFANHGVRTLHTSSLMGLAVSFAVVGGVGIAAGMFIANKRHNKYNLIQ